MKQKSKVFGVGINDADYAVQPKENGVRTCCPFYRTWRNMLERCYYVKYQEKFPTYAGCVVAPEWHLFSVFRAWMQAQDWNGKHLDKDIYEKGNKIYSSDTCLFVSRSLNMFLTGSDKRRGKFPIGVCQEKSTGRYVATCGNPFTKKNEFLGRFSDPIEAHRSWACKKAEHVRNLAKQQTDPRVAAALVSRAEEWESE